MRIEHVTGVLNSIKQSFKETLNIDIDTDKPIVLKDSERIIYNVSVEIEGRLNGSILLAIDNEIAKKIAQNFVDEANVNEGDIKEVFGEVINKIALSTKKELKLGKIEIGKESYSEKELQLLPDISYIEFPCSSDIGTFSVIAGLEYKKVS